MLNSMGKWSKKDLSIDKWSEKYLRLRIRGCLVNQFNDLKWLNNLM